MATITKTFTENWYSSNKATWTVNVTGTNQTVSTSTFSLTHPTVTAKYTGSNKGYAASDVNLRVFVGGVTEYDDLQYNKSSGSATFDNYLVSWASGTQATLTRKTSLYTKYTNDFFNSNNKTTKTINVTVTSPEANMVELYSAKNKAWDSYDNAYSNSSSISWGTIATITLDAPPVLTSITSTSSNTNSYYWKDITTASVKITSSMIQYGGGVSEATLTIGEQTATITDVGTLSIKPNTVGTFTPVLTVTDTRGQTTTKELTEITVQQWQNISASWGTVQSSNTNGYYAGKTTASVTVNNISLMSGFNITSAQFIVGNEKQTISSPGTSSITFSLPLTAVGTFTPQVKINTDAYVTTTHSYSQITVNEYVSPSVNIEIERTKINTSGKPDIEGENAVITATFDYLNSGFNLKEPEVLISEADNQSTPENATITWYQTRNSSDGVVSNAVNWSSYNPQSPVTLYGLITGYGTTTKLSSAQSFQILITPKDSASSGTQISQVLPFSFYTIDFQAGGKEIAFGAPANDDLTNINGKDYSDEGLFKCNMGTAFNDMTAQEVTNFVSGLDFSGKTVVDYIVEQGTTDGWDWRKWNSGFTECLSGSATVSGSTGALYFHRAGNTVTVSSNGAFVPSASSIASGTALSQTIPNGFNPVSRVYAMSTNTTNRWRLEFSHGNSSITFYGDTALSGNMYISSSWITNDDVPV